MRDPKEHRAREMFNAQFPDRYWNLTAIPRVVGADADSQSATEEEREQFRAKAEEAMLREMTEATTDATRT